LGDKVEIARALLWMAAVAECQGDDGLARSLLEEGFVLHRKLDDMHLSATLLRRQADILRLMGSYMGARLVLEECLRMFLELGDEP
jgi:hypothetical protein